MRTVDELWEEGCRAWLMLEAIAQRNACPWGLLQHTEESKENTVDSLCALKCKEMFPKSDSADLGVGCPCLCGEYTLEEIIGKVRKFIEQCDSKK